MGDKLKFARFFASTRHAGQSYSGGVPYTHHLAAVEQVLREHGTESEELLAAAWLHDVVEDTDTSPKEILELFGAIVHLYVSSVTSEEGPNRKTRNALTYPKIRGGGAAAVRLKLADRIANVRCGGALLEMYRREQEDFRRSLYTPGENEDMWATLDAILFPEDPDEIDTFVGPVEAVPLEVHDS